MSNLEPRQFVVRPGTYRPHWGIRLKKAREGMYLLHVELHNCFLRKAECTQAAYIKGYGQSCEGVHCRIYCFLFHLFLHALSSVTLR